MIYSIYKLLAQYATTDWIHHKSDRGFVPVKTNQGVIFFDVNKFVLHFFGEQIVCCTNHLVDQGIEDGNVPLHRY